MVPNATIFSNIGEWSNATILQLMQLYATILQLYATYATILQQFHMQLYEIMQLFNMQLMQLQQLYGTYATLCNYIATICNYQKMYIGTITYLLVSTSVGTTK